MFHLHFDFAEIKMEELQQHRLLICFSLAFSKGTGNLFGKWNLGTVLLWCFYFYFVLRPHSYFKTAVLWCSFIQILNPENSYLWAFFRSIFHIAVDHCQDSLNQLLKFFNFYQLLDINCYTVCSEKHIYSEGNESCLNIINCIDFVPVLSFTYCSNVWQQTQKVTSEGVLYLYRVQQDGKSILSAADVPLCPLCTLENYPLI